MAKQRAKSKEQRAKGKEHILSLRGEAPLPVIARSGATWQSQYSPGTDSAISNKIPGGVYPEPRDSSASPQNDIRRKARNERFGVFSNEKGIALVMILVLSAIALAIMAGLIYMITSGTQLSGIQKRYKTALEAGIGGADVTYQVIGARIDSPLLLENEFNFLSAFDVTATQTCMNNKLASPTNTWNASCDNSLTINPANPNTYDMSFTVGVNPAYVVFSKIVDTVEGNTGIDEGLLKTGVIATGSGEVPVVTIPYFYTIEVYSQSQVNPPERAQLSILYQH